MMTMTFFNLKLELTFHVFLFLLDEENTTEHTPTHHMLQPPQAVFPACICAAVLPIVHLMEDGEVREDGVAGKCQLSTAQLWTQFKKY